MLDEKARTSQAACMNYRFVLRGRKRLVLADDQLVELGSRALDVLLMLAGTAGDARQSQPANSILEQIDVPMHAAQIYGEKT